VRLVTTAQGCRELAREAAEAPRIALDLESDGLFAYRARVCTAQLAWKEEVAVVDVLATSGLAPLAELLSATGPVKVVHDTAFDARLLAEAGVVLGNVHDTAILARMLGRTHAGLSPVLLAELGVHLPKDLQHHDWRKRPLDDAALGYLTGDVLHLEALDDVLFAEAVSKGVDEAAICETDYRIERAVAAASAPEEPAYLRLRGVSTLTTPGARAVARRLAELREREAARRDVPPHRVISADAVVAIAEARPRTMADLTRIRGVPQAFGGPLLRAVEAGLADGDVPEEERRALEPVREGREVTRARRAREARLTAWRREQAKARGVDEQAVLPGHCLKSIAGAAPRSLDELRAVKGIGAFRVARDGAALLACLEAEPEAIS
jgi:ribonuclease D